MLGIKVAANATPSKSARRLSGHQAAVYALWVSGRHDLLGQVVFETAAAFLKLLQIIATGIGGHRADRGDDRPRNVKESSCSNGTPMSTMVSLSDIAGAMAPPPYRWPAGEADTMMEVYWLQGPQLNIDLRIPERRPRCKATCLRELDRKTLGFGPPRGLLRQARRARLDWTLAPRVRLSQLIWTKGGHLAFEDDVLVERGVETPNIEHWVVSRI